MSKFDILDKAMASASMKESTIKDNDDVVKFQVRLPKEITNRIAKIYGGSRNSYILMAVMEKLKRDET